MRKILNIFSWIQRIHYIFFGGYIKHKFQWKVNKKNYGKKQQKQARND
jgi:hypothetical protein